MNTFTTPYTIVNPADQSAISVGGNNDNNFEFKATTGQINIDSVQGIVEAFVSAIGNKDSVGDIVLPGAFDSSLKRRKPRVVWGHDWNQPIGKVIEMFEVPQSDPRLPAKMKQAGVGALYAKVQFNLNTERGREAFANVAFYGSEQEWSIGYKTIVSSFDHSRQANLLKEVELYEVSPVLHGANQLTSTLSVKDDSKCYDDDHEPMRSELISGVAGMLSGRKLRVLALDATRVVFIDESGVVTMSPIHSYDGAFTIGKPVRVKPEVTFVPVDESYESVKVKLTDSDFNEFTQASYKDDYDSDDNATSSDNKPDYLEDPMALLLMAYNEMLKWRGASNVRSATLRLIADVEKFLTVAPASLPAEQGEEKTADYTTIRVFCETNQCEQIKAVVADIASDAHAHVNYIDITLCVKDDRDSAMRCFAEKLALLDFYPKDIAVL